MKNQNDLTVQEALQDFYYKYHIPKNGGVDEAYVKVEIIRGINLFIPNFEARKKVLLKHDIHHVLTGYPGVMKGETEISAWEISTGCLHNWVALMLNYYGLLIGVVFNLPGTWKAFLRGTRTKNLYKWNNTDPELLEMQVGPLKKNLGLFDEHELTSKLEIGASLSFFLLVLSGAFALAMGLILVPVILMYSLYIWLSHHGQSQIM